MVQWYVLTPKKLAFISVAITLAPIFITLLLSLIGKNGANSSFAYYTIMLLPISVIGLVISGIWYLFAK